MGKIFCLMGKSASGKDTIYKKLLEDDSLCLKRIVPYTTRPRRAGEKDGETYNFCTEDEALMLMEQGRVIEMRSYETVCGIWRYFTADDGQISFSGSGSLMIGTVDAYDSLREYFGPDNVRPVYLWLDDGERLERALSRERAQLQPHYAELCRRFLADEEDFSDERLAASGITSGFENSDINELLENIKAYIRKEAKGSTV